VILALTVMPRVDAAPINNQESPQPIMVETTTQVDTTTPLPTVTEIVETAPATIPEPERPPEPKKEVVVEKKPVTGSKEEWLRLANIPESEWGYVDFIVQKESSWNPNAVNPNGGACGLAQALPCSKLGTNWNDPVHALKWQHAYVTDRYGGYAQAYSFWKNNNWY